MTPRAIEDVPATSHFYFLYGSFNLSKWKIPYLASTVTLEEAARDLNLTTDIPGGEAVRWKIDELYQRDINWSRVERQIVPYLRATDIPQFFNSITIALLPWDSQTGALVSKFTESDNWNPPPLGQPDRFLKQLHVGPITLGYWDDWATINDGGSQSGQLRWNTREIFGVAIDGQHRLAAIKAFVEGNLGNPAIVATRVPVIFLIFDERLGFEAPVDQPIIELLRRLFIDLNKHAEKVTRARQMLLDDRDPHAVSVRQLIGEQLNDHLDDLNETPPRLPLALVDWHSEGAKFDQGPYLTTILGLDWIVSRVLDTRPIGDLTDYGAVRTQLSRLQSQLGIPLGHTVHRLEDLESVKLSPFTYDDADLELIGHAFGRVWSGPLIQILTKFSPYAALIAKRIADGTLSLDFQSWFRLNEGKEADHFDGRASQEYRRFLGRIATRQDNPISEGVLLAKREALNGLKRGNLAFNVVFQRALILAYLEYAKIGPADVDELTLAVEEDDYPDFGLESVEVPEGDLEELGPGTSDDHNAAPSSPRFDPVSHLAATTIERAGDFVTSMNLIVDCFPEFLDLAGEVEGDDGVRRSFWLGTFLKSDGTGIDFTQGASMRARELILVCAAMCLYASHRDASGVESFDEFWVPCLDNSGTSVQKRVGRAIRRFCREASAGGRILKSQGDEYDEDGAIREMEQRIQPIWKLLGL